MHRQFIAPIKKFENNITSNNRHNKVVIDIVKIVINKRL